MNKFEQVSCDGHPSHKRWPGSGLGEWAPCLMSSVAGPEEENGHVQ